MIHTNMVDKYIKLEKSKTVIALRGLTMTEDVFACHFPNFPILPGVLMLQALEEVSGKLVRESQAMKEIKLVFKSFSGIKFRKYARPGDQLFITASIINQHENSYVLKGTIRTSHDKIADVKNILIDIEEG